MNRSDFLKRASSSGMGIDSKIKSGKYIVHFGLMNALLKEDNASKAC
jgi:hypothetical protein